MYDFTQPNYFLHQRLEEDLVLRDMLRDCKTEEERREAITRYQGMTLFALLISFLIAVVICGIITLLA